MATYYRWRQRQVTYTDVETELNANSAYTISSTTLYRTATSVQIQSDGTFSFSGVAEYTAGEALKYLSKGTIIFGYPFDGTVYYRTGNNDRVYANSDNLTILWASANSTKHTISQTISSEQSYVYSTSASAYPNGGVQNGYYYDQRTTITSPTEPGSLSYPSPITASKVTVSWGKASSNVPSYDVITYEVSYATNGGSNWTVIGTTSATSLLVSVPIGTKSIQFRVRAKDSNGQWGSYKTGSTVSVLLVPTLTAPSLAMQGQDIAINWTAVDGATSYTLQRKSSEDEDWVQVYSGTALTFTEAIGAWTSVQYQVQADFDGITGEWTTSNSIPVISATALVISGQDEDLGTLVNDVPYTISTDTGNQITVKATVNGAVILDGTVPSGTAETIPVLDLVHGDGTIVIEASVQTDGGTVSAVRAWTYNKAAITFPGSGSPSQLTKEGENIWPKTLAECVRLPGGRTLEEVTGFPAQIYVGRYTGTGTYGSGDPNELTIPFKPQAVFVTSGSAGTTIPMVRPGTKAMNGSTALTVAWADDGVSWYSTSAANQLNTSGTTYDIVAFG